MNRQTGNKIEKRHHIRRSHQKLVILESLQAGINADSRMLNSSEGGLYFESDQLMLPGSKIFIRIENFPQSQTESYICHHARIKWGKRLQKAHFAYGYGAEYITIPNQNNSTESDSDEDEELRKHPRKHCAKPATLGFGEKITDGIISDISRGGCFIETGELFNTGQILDLVIPGSRLSSNKRLKVEIVRLSPVGVGVKFKRIIKKDLKA